MSDIQAITAAKKCFKGCAECGGPVTSDNYNVAFCSVKCRKDFNNRRATRGAELYDLFMSIRYERKLALVMALWTVICRMAEIWRDDDVRNRAGRKSWGSAKRLLDCHPEYKSRTMMKAGKAA